MEDRRVGKDGRVTVVRRYLQTRLLGKGGFAKCYKFTGLDRHNHKKVFAGKVVVKSSLKKKSAREKVRVCVHVHCLLPTANCRARTHHVTHVMRRSGVHTAGAGRA